MTASFPPACPSPSLASAAVASSPPGIFAPGAAFSLAASRRRPRNKEAEDFPLIVTPVSLPWFDHGYKYSEAAVRRDRAERPRTKSTKLSRSRAAPTARLAPGNEPPHVLLLGLSFLADRRLTIDVDQRRMLIDPLRASVVEEKKRRRS